MIEFDLDAGAVVSAPAVTDTRTLPAVDQRRAKRRTQGKIHKRVQARSGATACEGCGWTPACLEAAGVPEPWSVMHAHHVVPVAAGGPDQPDNIVVLCPTCHALAHRIGWRRRLGKGVPIDWLGPKTAVHLLDALRDLLTAPDVYRARYAERFEKWNPPPTGLKRIGSK